MSVYFDKAKKRWRFSFNRIVDGQRYRSTKLLPQGWSRAQAEAFDRQEGARLSAQATGIETPRLPLAGAVQLYIENRVPTLGNGRKVIQDLNHLYAEIESAYLDEVSELASKYVRDNRHLADGTLHNRLAYLRSAVRYAYRHHRYGDRDYSDRMIVPRPNNDRQVYARLPELNRLWKALPLEARALFKLVFYMGLRWRAELLTRSDTDIERNGKDVWLRVGVTKNGRPVMKPVHPAVHDCLKWIPFPHADSWYYDRWRAAVETIGRPDLKPHDLRHSLASEVLSRPGGTLDDVRAALHHKSLQAADRYAHLYPERMQAILHGIGQKRNKA